MLIGAVVIGMSAMIVSAEEETIPGDVIDHDASNGERGLDTAGEEDNPDGDLIIAPNPNNTDETETIGIEETDTSPVESSIVLGFAGFGAIVVLITSLIVLKRKK